MGFSIIVKTASQGITIAIIALLIIQFPIGIMDNLETENKPLSDNEPSFSILHDTYRGIIDEKPGLYQENDGIIRDQLVRRNITPQHKYNHKMARSNLEINSGDIEPYEDGLSFNLIPEDPQYVPENSNNYTIEWIAEDHSIISDPDEYDIRLDGSTVKGTASWENFEVLFYDVSFQTNGTYTLSIRVDNTIGAEITDEMTFHVYNANYDPIAPQFSQTQSNLTVGIGEAFTLEWNATDAYMDNYEIFLDDVSIAASGMSSGELIQLPVDGKAQGLYNYTFVARDANGNEIIDTAFVTVDDQDDPVFQSPLPVDFSYEVGTTGHSITWTVQTEDNPSKYVAYSNGSILQLGSYSTGSPINVNVDNLDFGIYNITIKVNDTFGNFNTDLVYLTVKDTANPQVNQPSDISQQISAEIINLKWNATDDSPDYYELYNNGSLIDTDYWTTEGEVLYGQSGTDLGLGTHNITIVFYDLKGQTNSSNVFIEIYDIVSPDLNSIADREIEQTSNEILNWTIGDQLPEYYIIYFGGTILQQGNYMNTSIVIDLSTLDVGSYTYNITLNDTSGNISFDEVTITVVDTSPPGYDAPVEYTMEANTTGNDLDILVFDPNPDTYQFSINGTLNDTGIIWNNGTMTFNYDGLSLGTYNFNYTFYDDYNNPVSFVIVIYVVDNTSPRTNHPDDISIQIQTEPIEIEWQPSDIAPDNYLVYLNGTEIQSGNWNNTNSIIVNLDPFTLGIGLHNITTLIYDKEGFVTNDTMFVEIYDIVSPELNLIDDFSMEQGEEISITWDIGDQLPDTYILQLGTGANNIETSFTNTSITIDLSLYEAGSFEFSISVNDTSGNTVFDSFIVTIVDTTKPSISGITYLEFEANTTGNEVTVTVQDLNPDYYSIVLNQTQVINASVNWSAGPILLNFDHLDPGRYYYNYTFFDAYNNSLSYELEIVVVDTTSPVIQSNPSDLSRPINYADDVLIWDIDDPYFDYWKIYSNGSEISSSDTNPMISLDISVLNLGTHNITIVYVDNSGNFITHQIWVEIYLDNFIYEMDNNVLTTVSEGDIQTIEIILASSYSNNRVNATVEYSLFDGNFVYYQEVAKSTFDGKEIYLDYSGLSSGDYTVSFLISLDGFHTLELDWQVIVSNPSINVMIENDPTFIKSKPFTLNLVFEYTGGQSGVSLSQYQQKSGPVKNQQVIIYISVIINGNEEILSYNKITDSNGRISVTIISEQTSVIDKITGIDVDVTQSSNGETISIDIPPNQLPQVIELTTDPIGLAVNFAKENTELTILVVSSIILVLGTLSVMVIQRKRRRRRIIERNEFANDLLYMITHTRVILLQSNAGTSYFKLNLVKLGVDTNLISGLTSALSSFMSEIAESENRGFEKVERNQLTIVSHRSDLSALVIVSDTEIPKNLYGTIKSAHQKVESKFEQRLTVDNGMQIPIEDFVPVLQEGGLPIAIAGDLIIRLSEIERIRGSLEYSEKERNDLLLLDDFFDRHQNGVKHEKIAKYLINQGVNPDYISYLLIKSFKLGHIIPVINDLEGTRRIEVLDEADEDRVQITGEVDDLGDQVTVETSEGYEIQDIDHSQEDEQSDNSSDAENREFSDDDFDQMLDDVDSIL